MTTPRSAADDGRRTRRTRRVVALLLLLVLLVAGAVVLVLVPDGVVPPRQAGSTLGASRGERYVGVVTDGRGVPVDVDLTVTADGRAFGTVARAAGGGAGIAVTGSRVLVRGDRAWWAARSPGRAAAPVGRWAEADPALARELLAAVRSLTPAAMARQLAAAQVDGMSAVDDRVVDGTPGEVWSDGESTVVISADDRHRLLAIRRPLGTEPSAMVLPGSDGDRAGAGPQSPQADLRVVEPTGSDLDDVVREVDAARRQAVPVDVAPDAVPAGTGTGDGVPAAEYGQSIGGNGRSGAAPAPPGTAPEAAAGAASGAAPSPGATPGTGSSDSRRAATGAENGGVDLTSVELRYVGFADSEDGPTLTYAFAGRPTGTAPAVTVPGGTDAVSQASDAFFVWLAVPRDAFWVNLNPSEPDRIIDPALARTDAGRVLLEADLAMKAFSTSAMDPRTPLGKQYWDSVATGGGSACAVSRMWIVPGPATVVERNGGLNILDAPLRVELESELPTSAYFTDGGPSCGTTSETERERFEAAERRLILPVVEKAVNRAPEFAELRRVYLSRVAAEWYRQRGGGAVDGLVDSGNVAPWAARTPWSPRAVFDRYVDAVRRPAVDVVQREVRGDAVYEQRIMVGGVDWSTVLLDDVDPATAAGPHPDQVGSVAASFGGPVVGRDGTVWLGSSSDLPDAWRGPTWGPVIYPSVAVVATAAAVWFLWRRQRRPAADASAGDTP